MNEESFRRLILEVVQKVVVRLGADGSRGTIAVALTGATSAFSDAVALLRQLILDGFQLQLAFSPAARSLYRDGVLDKLAGFPHVSELDDSQWLSELKRARMVVVPLLTVNSLSKLALLVADTLPLNIALHALFLGKPVLVAVDGVHPDDPDRRRLGLEAKNSALRAAVLDRLGILARYGCVLCDLRSLREKILQATEALESPALAWQAPGFGQESPWPSHRVITAADVRYLSQTKGLLSIPVGVRLTPLAREIAQQCGVHLEGIDSHFNQEEWS